MSTNAETNVQLAQRVWDEVWHQGKLDVMAEIFDANFQRHDQNGSEISGLEQNRQFISRLRAAFPDLRYTIDDVIASGNKVVTRYRFDGTHTGDALGFPPTNKPVSYTGIMIQRFADGKIVEQWTQADLLTMYQQVGVIPPLGPR